MTSLVHAESFLVIDVGSISTRAFLFDVVDQQYRFIAVGVSPTTINSPFFNISEGVRRALDQLQEFTGRRFIGKDEQLIIPVAGDGSGVDRFAASISVGKPLNIVAVGLLEDVSLESACHLASTINSKLTQVISLNDRRKQDTRINMLLRVRPDLIIAAGGTNGGASLTVKKLLETVGLACYLMPENQRPEILFAGNQVLEEELKSIIGSIAPIHFAPNIRPTLEREQLDPSYVHLANIYSIIRTRQIPGAEELYRWSEGNLMPTSVAFGRIVRFLSKVNKVDKRALGIDIGSSATTLATAYKGELSLKVFPGFGIGSGLGELLDYIPLSQILKFLPEEISENKLKEFLANNSIYPSSLPATQEEMTIAHGLVRQIMQEVIKSTNIENRKAASMTSEYFTGFEPILATGSILTQAPSLAHSALLLLDGLQPVGITTLILDQNQITPALGAASLINPILVVQILNSNSLLHLGTVIAPVGFARTGSPVLRVRITYQSGQESKIEVKQGSLERIVLPYGQPARLHLQPLLRYDIGMGAPGRGGDLRVTGGALGVIIDARGRPIRLPEKRNAYQDLQRKWFSTLES